MRLIALLCALALLPAIAFAATPRSGGWSGTTKQGKSISFRVSSGKVTKLKVGWKAKCGPGSTSTGRTSFGGKYRVVGGKFTAKTSTGAVVRGTFTSSRRASGTLKVETRVFTGFGYVTCSTGKVRWNARR